MTLSSVSSVPGLNGTEDVLRLDHDKRLRWLMRPRYSSRDVGRLRSFLDRQGTFEFPVLPTGLFSAARLSEGAQYTGYDNVWVRDNVHIAHAYAVTGRADVACRTLGALRRYFQKHRRRFLAVIRGEADPADPMNRPHVRFNGLTLEENPEKWSHAQNDALGYFLWLFCRLALSDRSVPSPEDWDLLGLFPLFFRSVRYWQDEDSGHWEEARKVEASSIGTVVAALIEMRGCMVARSLPVFSCAGEAVTLALLDDLIGQGRAALSQILPAECVQPDPARRRRYDAALLFLIYPLQVVDDAMADRILQDVRTHLQGDYGVRRYLGDSFWCADYKSLQRPEARTADVSEDMSSRDALLRTGEEAQWCLFDPVLSTIYGRRYAATGDPAFRQRQVEYFHRSLGQLTARDSGFPEFLCPELYYLEGGHRVPNDVTPLLWTQANLSIALEQMRKTAGLDHAPFPSSFHSAGTAPLMQRKLHPSEDPRTP